MQLTPLIAVHLGSALAALVTGPFVLWARLGRMQRPLLHRALGYTWVVLMVVTAVTTVFIRDFHLPNIGGYTPIHLFVVLTFGGLWSAFRALAQRNIIRHRRTMLGLYLGACVGAGLFTLLPGRLLGQWVWGY